MPPIQDLIPNLIDVSVSPRNVVLADQSAIFWSAPVRSYGPSSSPKERWGIPPYKIPFFPKGRWSNKTFFFFFLLFTASCPVSENIPSLSPLGASLYLLVRMLPTHDWFNKANQLFKFYSVEFCSWITAICVLKKKEKKI